MDTKQFTHKCVKMSCANTYTDTDPDPYFCASCREENKKIAAEIDARLKSRPKKKTLSLLDEYNSQPKGPHHYPIFR